jgi:hypothetical protein
VLASVLILMDAGVMALLLRMVCWGTAPSGPIMLVCLR